MHSGRRSGLYLWPSCWAVLWMQEAEGLKQRKGRNHKDAGYFPEPRISGTVDSAWSWETLQLVLSPARRSVGMHGPNIGTPVLMTPSSPLNGITVLTESQCLLVHILKKDDDQPSTLIRYRPPTLPHRAEAACRFRWEVGAGGGSQGGGDRYPKILYSSSKTYHTALLRVERQAWDYVWDLEEMLRLKLI